MEKIGKILVSVTFLLVLGCQACHALGCDKNEVDALLEIKSVINYPDGTAFADWSKKDQMESPNDCCDWMRVQCGTSGRVVGLDLAGVRQRDWYVNASLFLPFPQLQTLDLSYNSITCWTPHQTHLSSLQVLYLGWNKLKGMVEVDDIEALENLQILHLSGNSIDGFKRSHGKISSTSKLEKLYLRETTFSVANTFLDSLSLFPSLKTLFLAENDFKGLIETSGWLCKQKNLQELDISKSDLHGQFPPCLRNLTSLQYLDLSQNNLYGELSLFLANLTALHFLDLSSNQFVGNVANSPLTKLTSLQDLSLSNNKLQIPDTFRSFANHSALAILFLDGNDLIPDNATHDQPFLPKFQLSILSLSNCNIVATLPHFILSQYNLAYLNLNHNYINGSFPAWIVKNNTYLFGLTLADNLLIGSLHLSRHPQYQLQVLDVSYNHIDSLSTNFSQSIPNILFLNLSRNSIKVITPSNFADMKNLSFLDLSYNHLNGEMPKHCFKGCFSLEALFLSHNNLGVTPSFSDSTSLKILRLNNNNFSGVIPSSLFLSSLEVVDLSNNHLGGQIPTMICRLNLLNFLDLSNNSFFGFLPPCFNGSNLVYVFLSNNKLNGSLLPVFKNNTSLVILDLGNNHLSGVIPQWIGDLRTLSSLILSNNNFESEIPTQVCSLNQLTILDLSSNNISGKIPHCLIQLTFQPLEVKSIFEENDASLQLQIPNLGIKLSLSFLGHIHIFAIQLIDPFLTIQNELEISTKSHTYTYVGIDLDVMSTIDLSCNNLSGDIPPGIGSMIGVRGVNLSHNELTGSIPSTLSKLSHVESLDLSYNYLSGSIPTELIQLNALAVFSVAHNNLSGRIPDQKDQFGTFGESSYQGNPYLCGPPLLNECSTSAPGLPRGRVVEDVGGSMDMEVFYTCFTVSSVIMFSTTLIVLYINPHWRRVWFYYSETWITWVYYFIVDGVGKAVKTSAGVIWRFIHGL